MISGGYKMLFLKFSNINDANTACNKIWCNYLLSYATNEEKLVEVGVSNDYFLSEISSKTILRCENR